MGVARYMPHRVWRQVIYGTVGVARLYKPPSGRGQVIQVTGVWPGSIHAMVYVGVVKVYTQPTCEGGISFVTSESSCVANVCMHALLVMYDVCVVWRGARERGWMERGGSVDGGGVQKRR